jgi:hypothetical protein
LLATPFGKVTVELPRFRCVSCGHIERCVTWPSHYRSTPELDRLRAHPSALMPFRVAANVLMHLLPADVGMCPETFGAHTLKIGEHLCDIPTGKPVATAMRITVTTDSTFIRSCEEANRHLEVRVGNVETSDGGRQVFGAVARSDTDIAVQIRRSLEVVGRTAATKVTAFTDGCPGLRSLLANAGVTTPPIADWFHIAMRLQHVNLAARGLLTDEPGCKEAEATIVTEVERLHWRDWNGNAKNAQKTFDRIRKIMHLYKGKRGHRTRGVASRKLWHALHEIDKYLRSRSARLVTCAARYRAGLRVGNAVTVGTANFLVNRRMNKSHRMRWSRRGADQVLQVRCAVYNGTLGSGFGQRFEPIGRPGALVAIATRSHQFLDTPLALLALSVAIWPETLRQLSSVQRRSQRFAVASPEAVAVPKSPSQAGLCRRLRRNCGQNSADGAGVPRVCCVSAIMRAVLPFSPRRRARNIVCRANPAVGVKAHRARNRATPRKHAVPRGKAGVGRKSEGPTATAIDGRTTVSRTSRAPPRTATRSARRPMHCCPTSASAGSWCCSCTQFAMSAPCGRRRTVGALAQIREIVALAFCRPADGRFAARLRPEVQ